MRRLRLRHDDPGRELIPMRWGPTAAFVLLVIVGAGALTMGLLYGWAGHQVKGLKPSEAATLRLDAIKTALAVAAAFGAAATLLITLRRQSVSERAQRSLEEDARQQRITTLYTAAVEQLGNEKAAVRLGGLYALERLGQDNPPLRQTVVEVICAYLRMPYTPPIEILETNWAGSPQHPTEDAEPPETDEERERRQELQVRLAAQRLLRDHTRPGGHAAEASTYWRSDTGERIDLDLSGSVLVNVTLNECVIGNARLTGVHFHGDADLRGAHFHGDADLRRAQFLGEADLGRAQFHGDADLRRAQFHGPAHLPSAQFHTVADLSGAQFRGDAYLVGVRVHGIALLNGTQFYSYARLTEAQFYGRANLTEAQFYGLAALTEAQFHGDAYLSRAQFHGDADLRRAQFHGDADLSGAQFDFNADLRGAVFADFVNLGEVQFRGATDLRGAEFWGHAGLYEAQFLRPNHLRLEGAKMRYVADFPDGWQAVGGHDEGWQIVGKTTELPEVSATQPGESLDQGDT